MNNAAPVPPPLPGETPSSRIQDPSELPPVRGFGGTMEALLRRPGGVLHHLNQPGGGSLVVFMLVFAFLAAGAYGLVVGTFAGGVQLWAAPLKLAGGLLVCALICLPSLYVFACLTGSTARFVDVAGMVAGLLALMTVLLVSFAPVAWVFSQSTESVTSMGSLHLAFWLVATYFGARFMYRGMARLGARSEGAFYFWICLFVLVVLQMTTALRPIIGRADTLLPTEKKFFLQNWAEHLRSASPDAPAR
jgi:hypothetical protein